MKTIKMVLPAGEIDLDATVTKVTGTKRYTLTDKISMYDAQGKPTPINAGDGTRFLVAGTSINIVPATQELLWELDVDTALGFLEAQCGDNH